MHRGAWRGRHTTREHIALYRADGGWNSTWTLVNTQAPLFGWGGRGGSQALCTDANGCPSDEDPHLWFTAAAGWHLLTHNQNNHKIHSVRGAHAWSLDGLTWSRDLDLASNQTAWPPVVAWANGTVQTLARRQRPSFILHPSTGRPTHLITGSDMHTHAIPGDPSFCEGCHWGTGFTLVQRLAAAAAPQQPPRGP